MRCWGEGGFGAIGDGTFVQRLTPVDVVGMTDATNLAAGTMHSCARRQSGTVACWGFGIELGNLTGDSGALPLTVAGLTNTVAVRSHIGGHSCVELADHTAKCWGTNGNGNGNGNGDRRRDVCLRPGAHAGQASIVARA